jgi:hypothetical protein
MASIQSGSKLGPYEILSAIGAGGMSEAAAWPIAILDNWKPRNP